MKRRDRRPILLSPDDVREAERVRKRLARLLKEQKKAPRQAHARGFNVGKAGGELGLGRKPADD